MKNYCLVSCLVLNHTRAPLYWLWLAKDLTYIHDFTQLSVLVALLGHLILVQIEYNTLSHQRFHLLVLIHLMLICPKLALLLLGSIIFFWWCWYLFTWAGISTLSLMMKNYCVVYNLKKYHIFMDNWSQRLIGHIVWSCVVYNLKRCYII